MSLNRAEINAELRRAIIKKNVTWIKLLLMEQADVNAKDELEFSVSVCRLTENTRFI